MGCRSSLHKYILIGDGQTKAGIEHVTRPRGSD